MAGDATQGTNDRETDYQTYRTLLELWSRENPIKTTKLQVLLAVNALLVSSVNLSGGIRPDRWYVYLAGGVFSLIWTFSIGRTSLFQDVWQIKMQEIAARYPNDSRFSILDTRTEQGRARPLLRTLGVIPSKYYLLLTPVVLAVTWLAILAFALSRA